MGRERIEHESHLPLMYTLSMKSGIKLGFCVECHCDGRLNDKPITIPFVFHFSCVKFLCRVVTYC